MRKWFNNPKKRARKKYIDGEYMKNCLFIIGLFSLSALCANVEAPEPKREYDKEATIKLRKLYSSMFVLAVQRKWDEAYLRLSEQMQELIREGADPNIEESVDTRAMAEHYTPLLSTAIYRRDTALMQTCVDHGVQLKRRDPEKNFIADTNLTAAGIKLLLQAKADLNHQDLQKRGLLHIMTRHGASDVVAYLCNAGLNPNAHSDEHCGYLNANSGKTPLHEIFWHYYSLEWTLKKMAILLFAGADPDIKSWDGHGYKTVFDYIRRPTHYAQDEGVYERAEKAATHLKRIVAQLSKRVGSKIWKEEYWPIVRKALIDCGVVLD